MAWIRNHTTGTSSTGTAVTATLAAAVPAGNLLAVWAAMDNTGTTTPTVSSIDKPGGETATWARAASHDASSATSAAAVRGELWVIRTTVQWASGTVITATLSASPPKSHLLCQEHSGVLATLRGTSGTGTSTAGTPSAATSGTALQANDLVLGGATGETSSTPSGDTDTTNGSWSTALTGNTGGGASAAQVSSILQYKYVTAAGVQTYNPVSVGTVDSGAAVASFQFDPNIVLAGASTTTTAGSGTLDMPAVLAAQYDAQAIIGLANGAAVATWDDSTANNRDLTQATATNQPTYQTAALNGLPGVRFVTDDWMQAAAFGPISQPTTVVLVVRIGGASVSGQAILFDGQGGGSTNRNIIQVQDSTWPTANWRIWAGTFQASSTSTFDTNVHIVRALFNGASSSLWVDDVQVISGLNPGTNPLGGATAGSWADNPTTDFFNGDHGEIRVYSGDISSDWTTIRNALQAKWFPVAGALSGASTTTTAGSGTLQFQLVGASTTTTTGSGVLTSLLAGVSTITTAGSGTLRFLLAGTSTTTTGGSGSLGVSGGGLNLTGSSTTTTGGSGTLTVSAMLAGAGSTTVFSAGALTVVTVATVEIGAIRFTVVAGALAGASTTTTSGAGALTLAQTRTITDPVGLSDVASQAATTTQTVTDPVGILDSRGQVASFTQAITDPVGLLDSQTASVSGGGQVARTGTTQGADWDRLELNGAGNLTLTRPSNATVGKFLVVEIGDTLASTLGLPASGGWAWRVGPTNGAAVVDGVAVKVMGASEPASYTFTRTGTGRVTLIAQTYQGQDTSAQFDIAAAQTASTSTGTVVVASVTTVTDGAMLIGGAIGNFATVGTITKPATMTEVAQATGTGRRVSLADETRATQGATGTRTWTHDAGALEMVAWSDALRPAPVSGGQTFTQTITDPVGILDAASQALAATRTTTDAVGISDPTSQTSGGTAYAQTITDPVGITDAGIASDVATTFTDPVGLTDSRVQALDATRPQTDPVGLTDAAGRTLAAAQTVSDPVGVGDSTSQQASGVTSYTLTDQIGLADQVGQAAAATQTQTDPVGAADSQARDLARPLTDPVGTVDAVSQAASVAQTATDPVGVVDSQTQQFSGVTSYTLTDPVGIADSQTRDLTRTLTDPLGLVDSQARDLTKTQTDPVGLLDGAGQATAAAQTATDPVGIADAATQFVSGPLDRTITDPVGIADQVSDVLKDVTPRWVEHDAAASGVLEGASTASGVLEGAAVGAGIVEGSSSF